MKNINPLKGGSTNLDLPSHIKKKAVINVKNNDNECFEYSTSGGFEGEASEAVPHLKFCTHR
ncbi:Uncharacterized protein FWK35_00030066 [Aphis craccivora]|uniref:Uncharacterized protein n=1 Tax=Aphis craccivora TaxID=307492 RepID=A0A6G0VVP2_APHCR|nr:Uncharacterized protein FWK35_00030066 [Aphis craccivora]